MHGKIREVSKSHTDGGLRHFVTLEVSDADAGHLMKAPHGRSYIISDRWDPPLQRNDSLTNVSTQRLMNEIARRVRH